ncbi:MAG: riboflavin synthase [Planctomycetota bacterium]|nr:MAG: riboflavin synthase [Planctomycetota bacterium]
MFTGIVEGQAVVRAIVPHGRAHRLALDLGPVAEGVKVGDSIAVDGACLTVVSIRGERAEFDVIRETVERTAFATLRVNDRVNVERSMRAGDRFHGHVVAGHVDGAGRVVVKREEPGQTWMTVSVPPRLTAFMIEKGSVAIDGVSLTLTEVEDDRFSVALIPHTLEVTTLGAKGVGSLVNVEVDPLGKWVRRLLTAYLPEEANDEGTPAEEGRIIGPGAALDLTLRDLRRSGFVD